MERTINSAIDEKIAEIKGLAPEAVAQATFRNAVTLFRLDAAGV